ncbi:MAG: SARP family transcriptional regulator [Dehalococcoidia bacterium]|nr:SARP family transcriptional regulator [Dehalococcoidia bacterium]
METAGSEHAPQDVILLSVLGRFDLRRKEGETLLPALTGEAQRLLALLALRGRLVSRASVAGTLWPESSEQHAYASLRSALSRLSALGQDAVVITDNDLELSMSVRVDLDDARGLAHRLLEPTPDTPQAADLRAEAIRVLSLECLPDWYDDWVLLEAEEWRQLRLHALAALALVLTETHRFGHAITAALAAIRADPLRESAWATLIRVHLAEGNQSEAFRAFAQYREVILQELEVEPTPALRALLPAREAR